jgi:hypothetical protein
MTRSSISSILRTTLFCSVNAAGVSVKVVLDLVINNYDRFLESELKSSGKPFTLEVREELHISLN